MYPCYEQLCNIYKLCQSSNIFNITPLQLLQASGCDEKSAYEAENDELAINELTVEEIESRRAQIAKMKSLMFYQEQKAKRTKKIKSKLFHKIRNKQNERKERLAGGGDADDEVDALLDGAEESEKQARDRVLERMTLKHKNNKWVKNALSHGELDENTRQEYIYRVCILIHIAT